MIAVIGEALIDLIGSNSGEYKAVVGGANANVAVALAVRGEPHAFLGRISSDNFGLMIRSHFAKHGVNLSHSIDAKEHTSLAIATLDENGLATYSFYINQTADWEWKRKELPTLAELKELGVEAIQFGCLAMAIEPGSKIIEQWLREIEASNSITLSHDLNIRPALGFERESERIRVERLNEISHIIKASDADVQWLYDLSVDEDLDAIANSWSAGKIVIITRGAEGVSIYRDKKRIDIEGLPIKLVDTIGAGDTFIANFLAELKKNKALGLDPKKKLANLTDEDLIAAARFANTAAALVCERKGCLPPTKEQVLSRLAG